MDVWDMIQQELQGHSWMRIHEILLAFILSSLIGLEREIKLKSADLRTHALVGLERH